MKITSLSPLVAPRLNVKGLKEVPQMQCIATVLLKGDAEFQALRKYVAAYQLKFGQPIEEG